MYFEVVTKKSGGSTHYHARIRGGNNETIFSSQIYYTKQSAIHACEVVKANAKTAQIREVTE
jgi:uncharacterized protein YegP (UPF0339 family)